MNMQHLLAVAPESTLMPRTACIIVKLGKLVGEILSHTMTSGRSRSSVGKTSSISAINRVILIPPRQGSTPGRTLCICYVVDRPSILYVFDNTSDEALRALWDGVHRYELVHRGHGCCCKEVALDTGSATDRPAADKRCLLSDSHRTRDGLQ